MATFDDLLAQLVLRRQLAAVFAPVGTPSTQPTLASYVPTYSTIYSSESLASALGYEPTLFVNVDARVQVMPSDVVDRIAQTLKRPRGEVVWACGGRELTARAPGLGAPAPG